MPEAVSAPKKGSDGVYGLKESDLVPFLIEAVKEEQKEIKAQAAEIAALKAAVAAMSGAQPS